MRRRDYTLDEYIKNISILPLMVAASQKRLITNRSSLSPSDSASCQKFMTNIIKKIANQANDEILNTNSVKWTRIGRGPWELVIGGERNLYRARQINLENLDPYLLAALMFYRYFEYKKKRDDPSWNNNYLRYISSLKGTKDALDAINNLSTARQDADNLCNVYDNLCQTYVSPIAMNFITNWGAFGAFYKYLKISDIKSTDHINALFSAFSDVRVFYLSLPEVFTLDKWRK